MRSIDKADAIKKKDLCRTIKVSVSLEMGKNMVTIVINFIGKLFIVQRMPLPITNP